MDAQTAVEEWEASRFDDGLDEAARAARRGFSGAFRSGTDWLFMADGDPVAVVTNFEGTPSLGDVDALDGAGGEALEAPHPGVARLAPMLALGGEVRGEYFSEDTPVGTVQDTLEDGGFTGYVELSENVLSGDYYVVFVEGRAEYVAVVGSTERLYTGADAEEKTRNEVGIYSVVAVDLPAVALPEPSGDERGVGGVADGAGTDAASSDDAAVDEDPATDPGTEEPTIVGDDPATGTDTNGPTDVGDDERDVGGGSGTATSTETDAAPLGSDRDPEADEDPPSERTIPSVDPDRSGRSDDGPTGAGSAGAEATPPGDGPVTDPSAGTATDDAERTSTDVGAGAGAALDALRSEVRALQSAIDRLEGRVAALETDGDDGTGEAPAGGTDGASLSAEEALSQTTLFVREGSRGGPTLEDAHAGHADRDALAANVRLERHTRFDEAGVTVEGEPYAAFLESSQAYEFVEWLTTELLFEIRVTDSEGSMAGLYDAIPEIDRVLFRETVTFEAGGEDVEIEFDVVVRDRNGAPRFVAALDDSREPTRSGRIERLVTDASDFCAASGSVVGAFAVTMSYFEPPALEVAREATTSSLLSRTKYRSYVNLTRKDGFHLCLVEARQAALHLTLPEL
jgi:hypothetical protein